MIPALQNIEVVDSFFGAAAICTFVGLYVALKKGSPQTALVISAFPGFLAQMALLACGIVSLTQMKPGAEWYYYILAPFTLAAGIDVLGLGLPLVPFLIIVGIAVRHRNCKASLDRRTSNGLFVLTVASYVLAAWINYTTKLY